MKYGKYTLELINESIAKGMDEREARKRGHHFEKTMRRIVRRDAKRELDRVEVIGGKPLTEQARAHGDWDSWDEYGFLQGTEYTDEEVEEIVDGMRIRLPYSPYDRTGRAFTMWISWHRNPSGLISIVHHIGLDV